MQGGPEKPKESRGKRFMSAASLSSVGLEMGAATAIGFGIGYWLDTRFGTAPWLQIIFLLFGVAAGFKGLYDATKKARRNLKD